MIGSYTITDDGPHHGWRFETDSHSFQFETTSRTVAFGNPPRQAEVLNAHFTLAVTVPRGDPQWELFTAADNSRNRQLRATLPALVLPRLHAALLDPAVTWKTGDRQVTDNPGGHATLPDRSWVEITAWMPPPYRYTDRDQADARRLLHPSLSLPQRRDAAFAWIREHVPRIPGLPGPDYDPGAADTLLRQIEASKVGRIEVDFANAISERGRETYTVATVEEARKLAAEHRPYNNTRVSASRIVGWRNGTTYTETVDLTSRPTSSAAAAFPARAVPFPAPASMPAGLPPATGPGQQRHRAR
ncbi:hypothetical protein ACWT_5806 [Actinoplanes sp. SE50]|uniref:hypothetical protein n=1 Tax=unclassified Actinoplanes TaxID=2626549 RepID=UPI00023EBC09|nr:MULTISPECIES: hypothetical protein [unclassified Actinoplanes]AEV86824.1 hypothetical protein ACPL_5937 [Actinoplanes sp. SE50/110]ATO85221.1 hypothetical protein ACWT_5806 [Actinoplanes sp. SE50]SLM02631.1 hypothetical protein ACSP50_5913 [Actinoplanes sp. SE50/110]